MLLLPGRYGKKLASSLGSGRVAEIECGKFANGELRVRVNTPVVGEECVVVMGIGPEVDELLVEGMLLADACRKGGAKSVKMLVPFLPYSFQSREVEGEAVSAQVIARIISGSGVDEVRVVDLHQGEISEMFTVPVVNVSVLPLWKSWAEAAELGEGVGVVAPDKGAGKRAGELASALELPLVRLSKTRDLRSLEVGGLEVVEGQLGKEAVLVDDAINSGRTVVEVSRFLRQQGVERVTWLVTHVLPVEGAVGRVLAEVDRLVVTNSVEHGLETKEKVEVVELTAVL